MGDLDIAQLRTAPRRRCRSCCVAFAGLRLAAAVAQPAALGRDQAEARGVDVVRAQRLAFFSASLATGAAVSLGGPIGFIGIIVPHLVRLLVGSDHRVVLPASLLFGGAFLVACDLIARTVLAPIELPVGIVTAVIGGPFFLWLLVTRTWEAGMSAFRRVAAGELALVAVFVLLAVQRRSRRSRASRLACDAS